MINAIDRSISLSYRHALSKAKGNPQMSDKERFFEEQKQKLRQFGKPGATKMDADKLIGSMFGSDKKATSKAEKGIFNIIIIRSRGFMDLNNEAHVQNRI